MARRILQPSDLRGPNVVSIHASREPAPVRRGESREENDSDSSGMDPVARQQIMDLFKEMRKVREAERCKETPVESIDRATRILERAAVDFLMTLRAAQRAIRQARRKAGLSKL